MRFTILNTACQNSIKLTTVRELNLLTFNFDLSMLTELVGKGKSGFIYLTSVLSVVTSDLTCVYFRCTQGFP